MKEIFVNKTFYAIGQGGFFLEVLKYENQEVVIVYDCGSVQSLGDRLEKEIKNFPYKQIDFLIISHLDKDHYNGVKELEKYTTIKKVVIPKLEDIDIPLFYGSCASDKDSISSFQKFKNSGNVIQVNASENNVDPIDENIPNEISHKQPIGIIKEHGEPLWLLKFYVDPVQYMDDNGNDILTTDEKDLINEVKNAADLTKDQIKELKKAYARIHGGTNGSSLAMISVPNVSLRPYSWYYDDHEKNFATWMNGDIVLKTPNQANRIANHYKEYCYLNFDYQLQHHGSHENFYRVFTEFHNMEIFIYYGYNNSHGHPNGTVLRKIKDEGVNIHDLTELDKNFIRTCIWHPW